MKINRRTQNSVKIFKIKPLTISEKKNLIDFTGF